MKENADKARALDAGEIAKKAMLLAAAKIGIPTKFIMRTGVE